MVSYHFLWLIISYDHHPGSHGFLSKKSSYDSPDLTKAASEASEPSEDAHTEARADDAKYFWAANFRWAKYYNLPIYNIQAIYIYICIYIYTQTMCIYIYVHRHSGLVSHGSSHWDAQPLKPWTSSYELCTACLKVLYMCYVYTVLYIYIYVYIRLDTYIYIFMCIYIWLYIYIHDTYIYII
jgi:hypothetical protein